MGNKTIVQLAVFDAPAQLVYDALTDSRRHADFTGDEANINPKVGGTFTAYGDYISGTFVKLVPGKKIVQKWRASDWPAETYSVVTIDLQEKRGVTTLHFTQEEVPDQFADEIAQGWHDFYWDRLREYLEKS